MEPTSSPSDNRSDKKTVWLVIPSFNDSSRLSVFLPELCSMLQDAPLRTLVQVVDDGSAPQDQAALCELIRGFQTQYPFLQGPIIQPENQGKGAAILRGWDAAGQADWVGFVDADGAVPAYEVRRLLGLLAQHPEPDIALFASRVKLRGRTIHRSTKRHFTGRIFATLVGTVIDNGIYDSQCGAKFLSRQAYCGIRPLMQEKRFAFDVELLALLNHLKVPVEEVPVDWFDVPGSKVSLLRDSLRMAGAVWTIRKRLKGM